MVQTRRPSTDTFHHHHRNHLDDEMAAALMDPSGRLHHCRAAGRTHRRGQGHLQHATMPPVALQKDEPSDPALEQTLVVGRSREHWTTACSALEVPLRPAGQTDRAHADAFLAWTSETVDDVRPSVDPAECCCARQSRLHPLLHPTPHAVRLSDACRAEQNDEEGATAAGMEALDNARAAGAAGAADAAGKGRPALPHRLRVHSAMNPSSVADPHPRLIPMLQFPKRSVLLVPLQILPNRDSLSARVQRLDRCRDSRRAEKAG
mmetsp:Transcript_1245/g.4627  ORF Transcript_1245/g.4627 Transcript_1245/m.4627 type:complete len:263 (+) Transcript_1245:1214-2002(+)